MLHLAKLSVGSRDITDLRAWQEMRARDQPPLRHRTRSMPRRAAEIVADGSIYWVIQGAMIVRQRVTAIIEDRWDDETACAGLVLDPELIPVEARPTRPFQGWRYLDPEAAPDDVRATGQGAGAAGLPPSLMRELRALCLI